MLIQWSEALYFSNEKFSGVVRVVKVRSTVTSLKITPESQLIA
ncbi:hypothetical protein D515_01599 [Grimontia indica]|uniref:Uncharacterized protein n=1 Tax=Grimontia indica TaxID=1056512 RepID=R1GZR6_9GAMM|nr:hypothetical protein D515_01599 [Grimontia indica]